MSNYSAIITSLNSKIEKLIILHKSLVEEKTKLKAENQELEKQIKELTIKQSQLENQNKAIRLAKDLKKDGENSLDLKLKINELVREIDKCIVMMSR